MFSFQYGVDRDLGAQLDADAELVNVRCYRCACVVKLWNRDHPFKFVNCLKTKMTPNFVRTLEQKKKEYKFAFECFPKLEKSNLIAMLLDEHYATFDNVNDDFYGCYLGVCDTKDSRKLVKTAFNERFDALRYSGLGVRKHVIDNTL